MTVWLWTVRTDVSFVASKTVTTTGSPNSSAPRTAE